MNTRMLPVIVGCLWLTTAVAQSHPPADAQEVMRKNFYATKLSGFEGDVTMTLINARNEQRVRKMSIRSMLKDNGVDSIVMTHFLQPADIKGAGFLQNENSADAADTWVYLPALGKTRRLAANNKRDSFFGADFSYGDILLPAVDEYRHTRLRAEPVSGSDCIVIESIPLAQTRSDSGYSRKLTWVDALSYVERKVEYYDLRDALLKTQLTFDLKEVEPDRQRWLATRREMLNHQTGHKTLYTIDRYQMNARLTLNSFSVRLLEQG